MIQPEISDIFLVFLLVLPPGCLSPPCSCPKGTASVIFRNVPRPILNRATMKKSVLTYFSMFKIFIDFILEISKKDHHELKI